MQNAAWRTHGSKRIQQSGRSGWMPIAVDEHEFAIDDHRRRGVADDRASDDTDLAFFRGLVFALPLGVAVWGGIVWGLDHFLR